MRDTIRIIELSDIHLCHQVVPTLNIINNLSAALFENENLDEVDIIIIAGDVFDRLVTMPESDAFNARLWIQNLVHICEIHDVQLRVLEGTPIHDWNQSKEFVAFPTKADVKYYDDLAIEFNEKLGLSILYLPDEYKTPELAWKDICSLLAKYNLTQVDIIVMHGAFEHQLPPHVPGPRHLVDRYSAIVKYGVFVGHIHKSSIKKKIYASGSFDRLRHGEEEPKGYFRAVIDKRLEEMRVTFIENIRATRFKDISVKGLSLDEIVNEVSSWVNKLPPKSFIKLSGGKSEIVGPALNNLKITYPNYNWSNPKNEKSEDQLESEDLYQVDYFTGTKFTSENGTELILAWIENKNLLSPELLTKAKTYLEEKMKEI